MDRLETAKQIALEAGKFILRRRSEDFAVETKGPNLNVVTQVDRESEQLIFNRIKEAAPDHTWLGEEESFSHKEALSDRLEKAKIEPNVWVVDPIDGTNNFVQGITGFTVSIALACHGEVEVGAIYDPSRDELFYAEKGRGAFMNGQRVSVSTDSLLSESVVGMSIPSKEAAREATLAELQQLSHKCGKIRSLGSAALHLAYVACGRLDAYWHHGLNAWDVAAGVLIVQEAGGQVSDLHSRGDYSLTTTDLVLSNGHIHTELLQYLR